MSGIFRYLNVCQLDPSRIPALSFCYNSMASIYVKVGEYFGRSPLTKSPNASIAKSEHALDVCSDEFPPEYSR